MPVGEVAHMGEPQAGATRAPEVVTLTLPANGRFVHVARILVGGLAARLDLSYEALDDLQLAVESILSKRVYLAGDEVTLALGVREREIEILVGPVDAAALRSDLTESADELGLRVLLGAVVDGIAFEERDGAPWLRLEKHVPVPARE
jgi:hypothetical protein